MAEAKRTQFEATCVELADFAKALSHPARIAILQTLAKHDTCICGQIVAGLPLAQSTVSQHLYELKKAGLIVGEIDGTRSCYCINREKLAYFLELIKKLEHTLQASNDCC